jgi:inosine-uridine nucleoside N-ribohydrolase
VELLARHLREGPHTLVATGPLTNVALLLALHPDLVERVVLMGGAIGEGNTTPAAEFNIWADPEAAARVFASGVDVTMVGLDVTHRALLTKERVARLRAEGGRAAGVVADLHAFYSGFHARVYGWDGAPVHDALALAHVVRDDLLRTEHVGVAIDTGMGPSRGRTLVYRRSGGPAANAHVAVDVDAPAFIEMLCTRIASLP